MGSEQNVPQPLAPETLRQLQLVILEMLLEMNRICQKHNICYSLIGGTLLGAVRHGGFIPWDDDVDTQMSRSEYLRFRQACETELNHEKYFLQDNTTDSEYRWGYARLRRKNSEFVRQGQEHLKMKTGIFLDIFVTDNIPDFYPLRAAHCFYSFILRKVLYSETGAITEKNAVKRWVYKLLRHIPAPFVFARLNALAKFWNRRPTRYLRNLTFPPPKNGKLGFPSIWYKTHTTLLFEGYSFPVIGGYKEYLAFKYGNYMQLPPPEKRHWHPATEIRLPPDAGGKKDEKESAHP